MDKPILMIFIGLFIIIATLIKPGFYWNSRKARRLRALLGDAATSIVYLAIGALLLVLGIKRYM